MIQTLRKKFIVTAMIAVSVLLVLMLVLFNGMNGLTNRRETAQLLEMLARNEGPGNPEHHNLFPALPGPEEEKVLKPNEENSRMSALYFSVRQTETGWQADVSRIADVTEAEAVAMAEKWFSAGSKEGIDGKYRYRFSKAPTGKNQCVALDISQHRQGMLRVLLLSLSAGLLCWLAMLLLVVLLSKKAIAPLAENIEKQRRFVTDAGHELKTPLAIILANTEAMELHNGETKWSRNIRTQTQRLNGLTQSLLALAQADENRTVNRERVDFSALIKEQLAMFEEPAKQKGLVFNPAISPAVACKGNGQQLATMLSVLIENAVQYAPAESRVDLALFAMEKGAVLQIRNQCDPLPDCPPEKLFDRFYRGDAARNQQSGGCGIGLSVAKAIADAHGGSLPARYQGDFILFEFKLS